MTGKAGGKAKAPISSHPVFPAIVALWFAALLGLGSFVLPVALLERLVAATGLGALVPAVEPPLGVTARILIALVAASIGAVAGLAVARKVAAAQAAELSAPNRDDQVFQRRAKRPISASEELGISKLDAPADADEAERSVPIPGRRRPLAIASESAPSDLLDHAPLPGEGGCAEPAAAAADTLDLGAFTAPDELQEVAGPFADTPPHADSVGEPIAPLPEASEREEPPMPAPIPTDPLPAAPSLAFAAPSAEPVAAESADDEASASSEADIAGRPLAELGMADLVARFALSLQRRTEVDAEIDDGPIELPPLRAERAAPPFAATDWSPPEPQPAPAPAAVAVALEPEPAPEHAAPAMPAALQPITFDEEDEPIEAEQMSGLTLSLDAEARPFARPMPGAFVAPPQAEPASAAEADGASETEDDDTGYSSLLAMKRPLAPGREFVRIEDEQAAEVPEPTVVFPGQPCPAAPAGDGPAREPVSQMPFAAGEPRPFDGPAPAQAARTDFSNPATSAPAPRRPAHTDTEHALRTALEKLQKMSGAA